MNPKPGITINTPAVILTYTGSSHPRAKSHLNFPFLMSIKMICPGPKLYILFHNTLHYGEELLHPCSTPKLEEDPLLTFHDCLSIHLQLHFTSRGHLLHLLRIHHATSTGTHSSWCKCYYMTTFRHMRVF